MAAAMEREKVAPHGPGDTFMGYVVLGVPFQSGDALALRRFPASSTGVGYTSVWHRSPAGEWTFYADVPAGQGCTRYFGPGVRDTVVAPIRLEWTGPRSLTVAVDGGRLLAWTLALGPTPFTVLANRLACCLPARWLASASALRLMEIGARLLFGAGRVSLSGVTPGGSRFVATPRVVWAVTASRAALLGRDLGPVGPITPQPTLGDVRIPRRGLFAFGSASMLTPPSR
jgi:hypothetical protein